MSTRNRASTPGDEARAFPSPASRALHYAALWALAGAQPLFGLLSEHGDFLIAHRLLGVEILALAVLILALPPGLLLIFELAVSALSRRLGRAAYGLQVGLLVCLLVLQAVEGLRKAPPAAFFAAIIAILVPVGWSVLRYPPIRSLLTFLGVGVALFPALFLLRPPIVGMLQPRAMEDSAELRAPAKTPIVMVIFDELPLVTLLDEDKAVNGHRFPNFARLAASSTWYRNASTVAQTTTFAVPAILTGRLPDRTRVANAASYPDNLFTWLAGAYRLEVFEGLTLMCPEKLCRETAVDQATGTKLLTAVSDLSAVYLHRVLPRSLVSQLPQVDASWRDFWSSGRGDSPDPGDAKAGAEAPKPRLGDVRGQIRRFVDSISNPRFDRRAPLFFLHLNLPHVPWRFLPSGREYGPRNLALLPHGVIAETWSGSEWETVQGWQRHILQAGFADRILGQTMDALENAGIWDESLVVVTADHGVAFRTGKGRRRVDPERPSDVMQVPLFIKLPAQDQGALSDGNVETIDILPTLTAALGLDPPWSFDGRSLFGPETAPPEVKSLATNKGHDFAEILTFPPELAGLDESLGEMIETFGSGEDPASLYGIGPSPALIGRPAAGASRRARPSRFEVELTDGSDLEAVDPASRFVPVHLAGRLFDGGVAGDSPAIANPEGNGELDLAVALNGTVSVTTRTHRAGVGELRFTAMVPEEALRSGRNSVEVFEIVGTVDGRPSLRPMARRGQIRYRLGRDRTPEVTHLVASDGRRLDVVPGLITGQVTQTSLDFRGHARSLATDQPVDSVVLFVGDRFVTASRPAPGSRGRFAFVVPYGILDSARGEDLRFFGLVGDRAAPLSYRDK